MPRKLLIWRRPLKYTQRSVPTRAFFALWDIFGEFEGSEAPCQKEIGIKNYKKECFIMKYLFWIIAILIGGFLSFIFGDDLNNIFTAMIFMLIVLVVGDFILKKIKN